MLDRYLSLNREKVRYSRDSKKIYKNIQIVMLESHFHLWVVANVKKNIIDMMLLIRSVKKQNQRKKEKKKKLQWFKFSRIVGIRKKPSVLFDSLSMYVYDLDRKQKVEKSLKVLGEFLRKLIWKKVEVKLS